MSDRNTLSCIFLESSGWGSAQRAHLAGDASNRRYQRLTIASEETAVLMDAPAEMGESVKSFIRITRFLRNAGFSAPEIYSADEETGFLLLEDLGDNLFARLLTSAPELEETLYGAAVDLLVELQKCTPPAGLPEYTPIVMAGYIDPVFKWYHLTPEPEAKAIGQEMLKALLPCKDTPAVISLRDYHAENLLWLPDRTEIQRVGLLDYQDAVLTHPAYDLVSLLKDARREVSAELQQKMIARFTVASGIDRNSFAHAYHALGVQRNLRILGVLSRLGKAAGKPGYLDLLPRVWTNLQDNLSHPDLKTLRELVNNALPSPCPEMLQRLNG
ncbi:MAG TPA: aminoglycoside phosphotransferase [Rhodobacteraceae bacterium]|nr:aminoglycoside phosphotransferase [Paracoccaceae bacterium]